MGIKWNTVKNVMEPDLKKKKDIKNPVESAMRAKAIAKNATELNGMKKKENIAKNATELFLTKFEIIY